MEPKKSKKPAKNKVPPDEIVEATSHRAGTCRVCGCTNVKACPGGCHWVEPDLCSKCAEKMPIVTMKMETIIALGIPERKLIYKIEVKDRRDRAEKQIEKFKIETGLKRREVLNEN